MYEEAFINTLYSLNIANNDYRVEEQKQDCKVG